MINLLISARRVEGMAEGARLGRIFTRLDRAEVEYRLQIPGDIKRHLSGRGNLRVEIRNGQVWCRVAGGVFRPSPFEFSFHSFWLTRRGMILVVIGLLEKRPPDAPFIRLTGYRARELKAQAARWLQSRTRANPKPSE
jgi:hypothetical protein